MKLAPGDIAAFLRQPKPGILAVLIFGPDDGLVRERAASLTRAVIGAADDPFRLTVLSPDQIRQDPARLADEARSLSLLGGRRVIRVRDAGDGLAATIAGLLDAPALGSGDDPALMVLEAGDLPARSSLRKAFESHPRAASIACYADGPREVAQLIRETLGRESITIVDDAIEYLVANLGNDRSVTRQELEKLALYAGAGGRVGLADAVASVGDNSLLSIDDLVQDAFDGRGALVEPALTRLFAEGEQPVGLVRAMMRHAQRLHLCAAQIAAGKAPDAAIRELRPPVFGRSVERFKTQLRGWSPARIGALIQALTRLEQDCKRTGLPAELLCRRAFSSFGGLRRRAP
ncbi:MAG TPA: DNA polymerase III subunit delta [Stellaceae bacterium]|nr:DNA polymerase III subunit delta [Stellaceae bacterium]